MADQPEEHPMRVDSALVRELAKLLAEHQLTEIEVEDGDRKIKVQKSPGSMRFVGNEATAAPNIAPPAPTPAAPAADPVPAAAPDAIKSPMVGTVFLSAEPGAKPFIAAGHKVAVGDTLLIVEAMKVMNPILSTRAGTVRQILVADGQPIEYDQPLVVID